MESYLLDIYSELGDDSEYSILLKALYLGCPYEVIIKIISYLEAYSANKITGSPAEYLTQKREEIIALLKIYDY